VHTILDMMEILSLIGIPNDSIQESTNKINTIYGPCNVSLRNSECPETLFSSEYSNVPRRTPICKFNSKFLI
jgi:hypothetical protein